MTSDSLQDGLASTSISQLSPTEIVDQCKRGISSLCESVAYLRDQTCIDLLRMDTEWMHSLSVLTSLFNPSAGDGSQRLPAASEGTTPTLEGLAAQVARITNQYELLERRLNYGGRRSVDGIETNEVPLPRYQERLETNLPPFHQTPTPLSPRSPDLPPFPPLNALPPRLSTLNRSSGANPFRTLMQSQGPTSFYIHTQVSPSPIFPTSNLRARVQEIVDPAGVSMKLLHFPRFCLVNSGDIVIVFDDAGEAATMMKKLRNKLPTIMRKPYILRWPGEPTPYLTFRTSNLSPIGEAVSSQFRKDLRHDPEMRRRFLASKVLDTFPILQSTTNREEEMKNFSLDQQVLVLALHGRDFAFAQDFAMMNPKAWYEGFHLVITASTVGDVDNWRSRLVEWTSSD